MKSNNVVRIGTRSSKLALIQAKQVAEDLAWVSNNVKFKIVEIATKGDKLQNKSLGRMGSSGVFVKEIERALLAGEIDMAVHSLKDLPVDMPAGLSLGAVTKRLTPFDVLISKEGKILDDLPEGAVVGTGSPRRTAQILNYRPDLVVTDIRGNIDTRIRKLREGKYDAIVVAAAGVERLGLQDLVSEIFTTELCLPCPGQGALGIQVRSDDKETAKLAKKLNDDVTRRQVKAERAFLKRLGAGCHVPAAALCVNEGDVVTLEGMVASPDGVQLFRDIEEGAPGEEAKIGVRLAERLMESGAHQVLQSLGVEC